MGAEGAMYMSYRKIVIYVYMRSHVSETLTYTTGAADDNVCITYAFLSSAFNVMCVSDLKCVECDEIR